MCVLEHTECVVKIDKCVLRFNEIELRIFEPDDVGYFHSLSFLKPHASNMDPENAPKYFLPDGY